MRTSGRTFEDLSVLARRGQASASEQRRLGMCLKSSPLERWLYALGRDYDQWPTACDGDDALLRRVVGGVAERQLASPRPRRRRLVAALIAVGGFTTIGAAAFTLPGVLERPAAAPSAPCVGCRSGDPEVGLAASQPLAVIEESPVSAGAGGEVSVPSAAVASVARPAVETGLRSAAEQFTEANTLRKTGRIDSAVAAYRRLQRQHPGSSEARLSHVLLGRILLQQGAASAAHEQFSSYLRSSPGGSLAEEALQGQATALRRTGRTAEERQVWRQLVARYPGSIYARRAQERLRELD